MNENEAIDFLVERYGNDPGVEEALMAITKPQAGWQPIETAPKDVFVLLFYAQYSSGSKMSIGLKRDCFERYSNDKTLGWFDDEDCWIADPTHWQPLPLPP